MLINTAVVRKLFVFSYCFGSMMLLNTSGIVRPEEFLTWLTTTLVSHWVLKLMPRSSLTLYKNSKSNSAERTSVQQAILECAFGRTLLFGVMLFTETLWAVGVVLSQTLRGLRASVEAVTSVVVHFHLWCGSH